MPFRRAPSCATAPGIRVKNRGASGGCQFHPAWVRAEQWQGALDRNGCDEQNVVNRWPIRRTIRTLPEDPYVNKRSIINVSKYLITFGLPLWEFWNRNKRLLINIFKYSIAVGLLTWVIWKNWRPEGNPGLADIWNTHVEQGQPIPHPGFLGLALLIGLASVLLSFVRWYVLVRAVDLPFRV